MSNKFIRTALTSAGLVFVTVVILLLIFALLIFIVRMVFAPKREFRNRNGRIYPESTLREAVEKFNENRMNEAFVGEIQHPEAGPLRMDDESVKVVMKIQSVSIKKDNILKRFFGFRGR